MSQDEILATSIPPKSPEVLAIFTLVALELGPSATRHQCRKGNV